MQNNSATLSTKSTMLLVMLPLLIFLLQIVREKSTGIRILSVSV